MSGMYNYNPKTSTASPSKWVWWIVIIAILVCGIWCLYVYKQILEMNSALDDADSRYTCIVEKRPSSAGMVLGSLVTTTVPKNNHVAVPNTIQNTIGYYADKWDVNEDQMIGVIRCESNFKHEGIYGDDGLAYGICQFHKPTFLANCDNCDYYSLEDQLDTMGKMWSMGKQSHWTCYTKIYGS